jgi:hypothetical protein
VKDDKAREAADHLQTAIQELIAAGQAFLSAFEDVVDRPDTRRDLLAAIETMAKRFVPGEGEAPSTDAPADDGEDGDDDGGFETIRVD